MILAGRFVKEFALLDPEVDKRRIGELKVFDGERFSLFNIGTKDAGFFEEGSGDEVIIHGSDLGGEGCCGDGVASGEFFVGVCVEIAAGLEVGKGALSCSGSENGLGNFEGAEMVGAVEEIVRAAAEVVGFEKAGLLAGETGLGSDHKINTMVVAGEERLDSRGVAIGFEIEKSEGIL